MINTLFKYLLLFSTIGVSLSSNIFDEFIATYSKQYSSSKEYEKRRKIFDNNVEFINFHNQKNANWVVGMNEFGDLNWSEFKSSYLGSISYPNRQPSNLALSVPQVLPSSLDWQARGAVTPIKNQEQCGSCWAFSTTGALEGLYFIKNDKLKSFSEQELVDCSGKEGNEGCSGGWMDSAFKYVELQGICKERAYPYNGTDGTCKKKCKAAFEISGFHDVLANNETELQKAVFLQPVSVAIEADESGFQFYKSGVFDGECGTMLDHAVLIVGWGQENATDYWKVKNSWGESWGDKGYILMARNISDSRGQCGIAMKPSFPTV